MKIPLILLPGFGADQDMWRYQIRHLSEIASPKVIVLNQNSRSAMAAEVLKQAPPRFALAGHSMGGWVAQEIAAKAPERLSSLILIGTWTRDNPQMIEGQKTSLQMIQGGQFEKFLPFLLPLLVFAENQKLLPHLEQMFRQRSPEVLCRQLEAMNATYATSTLVNQISCPTLIIHGRQDALFSLEEASLLEQNIQQSKLALIEECGHLPPLEQPQATTALMRLWLTKN
jgi:pimeloyl-ACP methyl ester carboxylesterase